MIWQLAQKLGADERAIRLARKIGAMIMWLGPLEVRRFMRSVEAIIDDIIERRRAA